MPATYEPIASTTSSSSASSVTLGSGGTIPGTYTDLVLIINGAGSGLINCWGRGNGDTGSNYSYTDLFGDGSSAGSVRASNVSYFYIGSLNTDQSMMQVHFQSYANTSVNKTMLVADARAGAYVQRLVNLWRSTSAITSITLLTSTGNFANGTTFSLYGIKAA